MDQSCRRKKKKSMLGKLGHRSSIFVPDSNTKTISVDQVYHVNNYTFSGSMVKSQLGLRKNCLSKSSEKKSTVKKNPFFTSQSKENGLFRSGERKDVHCIQNLPNARKCLFSNESKENEDPIHSNWNYETSVADMTGIVDLPLNSAIRPKSSIGQRDKLQEHNSEKLEIGNTATPFLKTPREKNVYNSKDFMGFTSRYYTPRFDLKSPTPPPSFYSTYFRQRQDKQPLLSADDNHINLVSVKKSPKNNVTNTAYTKYFYKSCDDVNAVNKLSNVVNKKLNFTSCDNISFIESPLCDEKKLEQSVSWESFSSLPKVKDADFKSNLEENLKSNWENISLIQSVGDKVEVNGLEHSSSKIESSKFLNETYSQSRTLDFPVNSTAIEYDNNYSFELNEMMTTLTAEVEPDYKNKNKLSVVPEEESCVNSEYLTNKSECVTSLTVSKSDIENLAHENLTLLSNFQNNVLNEYTYTLKEKLSLVIKEQIMYRNKMIESELESVLKDKFWILKNDFDKQYLDCNKLIESLKTEIKSTDDVDSCDLNKVESSFKDMVKKNEKMIDKLQAEIVDGFQNKMLKVLDKSVCEQVEAILCSTKDDLEKFIQTKWELVNQQFDRKKQQSLLNLEIIKDMFNKKIEDKGGNDIQNNIDKLLKDLSSFSSNTDEIINDYKKHVLYEFQNKIEMTSKHVMNNQVDEIFNIFKDDFLSKLNSFTTEIDLQEKKWSALKNNILNVGSIKNTMEKCSHPPLNETVNLKSGQNLESTKKIYSELRSQYKFCLKTPEPSSRFCSRVSNAWTPRSMSTVVSVQLDDLYDDIENV